MYKNGLRIPACWNCY